MTHSFIPYILVKLDCVAHILFICSSVIVHLDWFLDISSKLPQMKISPVGNFYVLDMDSFNECFALPENPNLQFDYI